MIDAAAAAPRSPTWSASGTRSCRPAWAGSPGPRLVSGTANAGGLGILASATMTLRRARAARSSRSRAAPTSRSASTCAPTPATPPSACDLLIKHGVKVASFALAPKPELIAKLKDHGIVVMPVDRRRPARREGRRLGRRRGDGPGRRGRRPHRPGADHAAAARRCSTPVDIPVVAAGGFFDGRGLAAALSYGAAGDRHGHPLPAHPGLRGARRGQAALPRAPTSTGTVVTAKVDGMPHRMLRTDARRGGRGDQRACAGSARPLRRTLAVQAG